MSDLLYWSARAALVVGWLAVGWSALRRGGGWKGVAVAAIAFASLRALRWNIGLLQIGRELLRKAGIYEDRFVLKVALATALALAVAAAALAVWRLRDARRRAALLAVVLQCALLCVETISIGETSLAFVTTQPARYLAEGALLACVAWGSRRRATSEEGA
ncbi:MAG: hypothetical protein FJ306_13810 [Planctomycetes bacterium]|nr:hypothetical protein [Planctomycetota bacterium]